MKRILVSALGIAALLALAGCSSPSASPVGVWTDPDGGSAFINEDGSCSGMYWNGDALLDIGGPMTCNFSASTLVVSQPPNEITYDLAVDGDSMTLTDGSTVHEYVRMQ